MKRIEIDDPHRKKHFEFFKNMAQAHFNINFEVDIQRFYTLVKQKQLSFNSSMAYIISRVANEIEKFRHRVREDHIVVHDVIHPSYSIPTQASDVFSFCHVPFDPDYHVFVERAQQREFEMQRNPSFEDEPGRDDFLFLSSIPWVPFTGFQHAMHVPNQDSVPRIIWGKYVSKGDKINMPVNVQVHHAVVNGRDIGTFYDKLQTYLDHFEELL